MHGLFKWVVLMVMATLFVGPGAASAQSDQTRSNTGRHQPKPPPEPPIEDKPTISIAGQKLWFVGLGGGVITGGDLWRIETTSGNTALSRWESMAPFSTSRFNASLASNFDFNLFVGRRLTNMLSARIDVSTSRMDIGAEALQGQQAGVFLYDRFGMTTLALTTETKLVQLDSYPYLNAGMVVTNLAATRNTELDQTQLGFRLGLGYLQAMNPEFSFRAEVRYMRTGFDSDSFVPQVTGDGQPEVYYDPVDTLHFFEVTLGVQINI